MKNSLEMYLKERVIQTSFPMMIQKNTPFESKTDMELDENVPADDTVDNPLRKYRLSNLDDVLYLDNYEKLPQHALYALFEHRNA